MGKDRRIWFIAGLTLIAVVAMTVIGPIRQDKDYHGFADTRSALSIPNFFNVISNLPFLIIGVLGLRVCWSSSKALFTQTEPLKPVYTAFFIGLMLIGFGSAYYHYRPDNFSLLWDRIPMSISFAAFFCAVVGECISPQRVQLLLSILVVAGMGSVLYWYVTETLGHGDLRAYLLVQFLPVALIPVIYWLYEGKNKHCAYCLPVLGAYVLAKIAETLDEPIYHYLNLSGHTIKHLLAATGTYFVYAEIRKRKQFR